MFTSPVELLLVGGMLLLLWLFFRWAPQHTSLLPRRQASAVRPVRGRSPPHRLLTSSTRSSGVRVRRFLAVLLLVELSALAVALPVHSLVVPRDSW